VDVCKGVASKKGSSKDETGKAAPKGLNEGDAKEKHTKLKNACDR